MSKLVLHLHLQGLRGIAICSVILFHYFPYFFVNGYLGVDLFFVLSGYLMAIMLDRHETIGPGIVVDFLYRRVKRIAPLYYLVLLGAIGLQPLFKCLDFKINLMTGWNALLFTTNLNGYSELGYFHKLATLSDIYTHTWSISVEMQFYLLFPFIWLTQKSCKDSLRPVAFIFFVAASLFYYFVKDESSAFYYLPGRVWQFLIGSIVYVFREEAPTQYTLLVEEKKSAKQANSFYSVITALTLSLLVYTFVEEEKLTTNYARVVTTVISGILLITGKDFKLLENKVLVFLGEISYSWYLIHWPMITLQKMKGFSSTSDIFIGLFSSLILAIALHFIFEKNYLKWEKIPTIGCIITLILSCLLLRVYMAEYQDCSSPPSHPDLPHMTKDEIKKFNEYSENYDLAQLWFKDCIYSERSNHWHGTCQFAKTNNSQPGRLLLLGNSWTANSAHLVYEECRDHVGEIFVTAWTECEVLFSSREKSCRQHEQKYMESIQKLLPDNLMIITRHVDFGLKRSDEEMSIVLAGMRSKLEEISRFVKEKVYILQVFPSAPVRTEKLAEAMETGIQPAMDMTQGGNMDFPSARKGLQEVVAGCAKCILFDYLPNFTINGTFYSYDPDYFIEWISSSWHLSMPGLERIRSVYTDLCHKL